MHLATTWISFSWVSKSGLNHGQWILESWMIQNSTLLCSPNPIELHVLQISIPQDKTWLTYSSRMSWFLAVCGWDLISQVGDVPIEVRKEWDNCQENSYSLAITSQLLWPPLHYTAPLHLVWRLWGRFVVCSWWIYVHSAVGLSFAKVPCRQGMLRWQ
jgi:hypothetical protein